MPDAPKPPADPTPAAVVKVPHPPLPHPTFATGLTVSIPSGNQGGTYGVDAGDNLILPAISASSNGVAVRGDSTTGDAVLGLSHSSQHAGVSAQNSGGGAGLWAQGSPAGYFAGNVHVTGSSTVDGDHNCKGTLNVVKDIILAAAAGDCAEEFDVNVADVEPGTVMTLDEDGSLRPSDREYDRKVAGVISGAGDYRPGMILDRRDSSRPRAPIALVGKVYCKVDAQYAPIEVGDLLTTSPTPGHAMKATDPLRAFGAVIGKALLPLRNGQGLIPVLIAMR